MSNVSGFKESQAGIRTKNKQEKQPPGEPLKVTFQYLNKCTTYPITAQIQCVKKCVKCFKSSI